MACRRDGIIPPEIDIMPLTRKRTPLGQSATNKLRKRNA